MIILFVVFFFVAFNQFYLFFEFLLFTFFSIQFKCIKIDNFINLTNYNGLLVNNDAFVDDILQLVMLQSVNTGCDLCLNHTETSHVDPLHGN